LTEIAHVVCGTTIVQMPSPEVSAPSAFCTCSVMIKICSRSRVRRVKVRSSIGRQSSEALNNSVVLSDSPAGDEIATVKLFPCRPRIEMLDFQHVLKKQHIGASSRTKRGKR